MDAINFDANRCGIKLLTGNRRKKYILTVSKIDFNCCFADGFLLVFHYEKDLQCESLMHTVLTVHKHILIFDTFKND